MPNMIRKKMGRTRAASAISEPEVPVASFFSLTTFHSLLHARGRAPTYSPANFALSFRAESRNLLFAGQTAGSSTAFRPPPSGGRNFARNDRGTDARNDRGMDARNDGSLVCRCIVQAQSLCKSPGLPACV